MHQLQCDSKLQWDTLLGSDRIKEWIKISKQINCSPELSIPRCIGPRNVKYDFICFCDASKLIYGYVINLRDTTTGLCSFVLAKNIE